LARGCRLDADMLPPASIAAPKNNSVNFSKTQPKPVNNVKKRQRNPAGIIAQQQRQRAGRFREDYCGSILATRTSSENILICAATKVLNSAGGLPIGSSASGANRSRTSLVMLGFTAKDEETTSNV
jgi:hypothetical protein